MAMGCTVHEDLSRTAYSALAQLQAIIQAQLKALQTGDHTALDKLDRELEKAVGHKERSFGALWEHVREHGCMSETARVDRAS